MRPRAVLIATCLLGACSSDPPKNAPLRLVLDTESIDSGCSSAFCTDYKMSCGATIMIRLTDPDTGEQLLGPTDNNELALCVAAPPSETICSLSNLSDELQLFDMPAQTVRVEVAIWSQDDVKPGACPTPGRFELFDVQGRPQPNFAIAPAFGGAAYFRAGEDAEVTVPLACPNTDLLSADNCAANIDTDVEALVTDMGTMQRIRKNQAPVINVAVGETVIVPDMEGGSFSILTSDQTRSLVLDNDGVAPVYVGSVDKRFGIDGKLACATTFEGAGLSTTTVSCEEVADGPEDLTLNPFFIRSETVSSALNALGLTEFPTEGLVIGRVVNQGLSPTSGVAVTPSEGNVIYLSEDLSDITPTLTSASGYFIALDVPAGATWTASSIDGRRHIGSPRGGLVQGKVSAVVIRMTGDVIEN